MRWWWWWWISGKPTGNHEFFFILFSPNVESNKGSPWISIFFSRSQVAGPDSPARGQPPRGQAPLIAAAAAGHASVKLKQFSLHRDFLSDWKKSDILWFCLTFKQVELGLPFFLSDLRPEKDRAFPWKPPRLCSAAAGSPCQRACHDNGTDQCSASGCCQGGALETETDGPMGSVFRFLEINNQVLWWAIRIHKILISTSSPLLLDTIGIVIVVMMLLMMMVVMMNMPTIILTIVTRGWQILSISMGPRSINISDRRNSSSRGLCISLGVWYDYWWMGVELGQMCILKPSVRVLF